MSKISCKAPAKKSQLKLVKRSSKQAKAVKANVLRITVLPVDAESPPFIKPLQNKNNDNNLKLV